MSDIKYVVTVDSTGALKNVEAFDKALEDLGKGTDTTKGKSQSFGQQLTSHLIPSFTAATLAADAIKKGLGFLKDQVVSTFDAAMEAERIDRALNATLEITGRIVPGLAEDLAAYAAELQKKTIYDDEAIKKTETLLAQMTNLDEEGIKKATRSTLGLASALGIDLDSAAMMVTKAMEGNFQTLQRYGIKVDETLPLEERRIKLMEMLEKMFQRATAETDTASGSLAQMKNNISDAKEKIGNAFLPALSAGAKAVGDLVSKLAGLNNELEKVDGTAKRQAATNEIYADTFYLITARAGRTSEYVTNLAKLYDYNYESIILMIEAGKYGKELEEEWNKERDKTNATLKALKDSWEKLEKGTRTSSDGSSEAAKKLQKSLQDLIDQADPLKAKYHAVLDDMVLVDKAFKTGAISAADYGKVMGWLQGQLRDVEKPIVKLATTELPKTTREIAKLIDAAMNAPRLRATPWGTTWIEDLQAFGVKAAEVMDKFKAHSDVVFSGLNTAFSQAQRNKEIEIENEYKTRLASINANIKDETERQNAIQALEAEFEIKRTSAKRAAARQQKAVALAEAIVNTADAVTKALAQGGFLLGIPWAAIVGALGAAQIALIARQPIPLARGAVFEQATSFMTAAGQAYVAGEAGREILGSEKAIREIFRDEVVRAGGMLGRRQGPVLVTLNVDGRKLAEALLPDLASLSGRGRLVQDVQGIVRSEQ
jgi:hypothetical protein